MRYGHTLQSLAKIAVHKDFGMLSKEEAGLLVLHPDDEDKREFSEVQENVKYGAGSPLGSARRSDGLSIESLGS